jgi:hypothetical protein
MSSNLNGLTIYSFHFVLGYDCRRELTSIHLSCIVAHRYLRSSVHSVREIVSKLGDHT